MLPRTSAAGRGAGRRGRPPPALLDPVVLLLAWIAVIWLVPPTGEFAVNDDWDYARSVYELSRSGRLSISPWLETSTLGLVLWGWLFSLPFGASFTTLRWSTLVLAPAGTLSCYWLIRWATGRRALALLGAMLLWLNPLYLHLSYSFMSDVPYLATALATLACAVRAVRSGRAGAWLVASSVLAGASLLVRQLAASLPAVVLIGLGLRRGWRTVLVPTTWLVVGAAPALALLALAAADPLRGPERVRPIDKLTGYLAATGPGLPLAVADRLTLELLTVGLLTFPLALGYLAELRPGTWPTARRWLVGGLLLGFALALVRQQLRGSGWRFPVMVNVLSRRGFLGEVGDGRVPSSVVVGEPLALAFSLLGALGGAALLVALAGLVGRRPRCPAVLLPLCFGAAGLLASLVYPNFLDRYLLGVVPTASLLLLWESRWGRRALTLACLAGVAMAAWSLSWQQDYLSRQRAIWQAAAILVERGVPTDQIDAGYAWNGWQRGVSVVETAAARAAERGMASIDPDDVLDALARSPRAWRVSYATETSPCGAPDEVFVSYGDGSAVVARRTC